MFFTRLFPNLHEENIYYCLSHVLAFFILQTYIFSMFSSQHYQLWDFITPWLIFQFVKQSFYKGFLLGLFASVLLESNGSVSFGYFIFLYWILCSLINYLKDSFSWRSYVSWKYSMLASILIYILYEVVYIASLGKTAVISIEYAQFAMMRLAISSLFGLVLIKFFMKDQSYFSDNT